MLNVIRAIVVIVGAILLIFINMDMCNFANFKMNDTLKTILYIIFMVCSIFFSIDGFLIWYNGR